MADEIVISHVTDHVARSVSRLLWQYRDKPRIRALISAYAMEIQTIEDALQTLGDVLDFEEQEGVTLANIARLIGLDPSGRDDATIRTLIRTEILINRSSGTMPELFAIVATLTALTAGPDFKIRRERGAVVAIEFADELAIDSGLAFYVFRRAVAEGVRLFMIESFGDSEHDFTFSDDNAEQADVERGFADGSSGTDGGLLVGVTGG